ncbi:MAG: hypothetical protein IIW56_00285 [Oscillospiraceae bacterium]|nr:hypothetical protein [Oscillospiraceae bacterium]
MGIAKEVGSNKEYNYTIYAQSAEDYLNSHAAFDGDVEFSLNLFLRTQYGVDLAGERNTDYKGQHFDLQELIYTYDAETGKYVKLDQDLLQSNFFISTLQKGTPYFIPSLDKDGQLDFTNPKVIKVSQYKGENQLFIMGDRQLRHAEDELKHVEKPTFWQRVADGFLKIFGSRNAACENYEKFQAMMTQTLKVIHNDHEKVKLAELGVAGPAYGASEKAEKVYGKDATIAASNVGTIADDLRADIYGSLNRMLNGEFDRDEARETSSKMVLLELIKRGRSFHEITGDLMAGRVESTFAQKPKEMVLVMRENPYIKAVCNNLTFDAFRQFVVNDGAKALADKIIGAAKEYNPDAKVNELQLQNVQEVQKQQSAPMI